MPEQETRPRFQSRRGRPMRGRGCERCAHRRPIDYKDTAFLSRFIEPTGKIVPARKSGCSGSCQRRIALAVKRARHLALLPYVPTHVRSGGRG
ncbi:MAG: 30S ribosomal protein S18 [Chloroflexi bacterium]|nr:30S ribosomal protein S18 [Chloroflexota bacterium]